MTNSNLRIDLKKKTDRSNRFFYIGKLKLNATLNLNEGLAFLVFVSEDGSEELQIAPFEKARED
jgi:hypothetical protein